jgi:site-specific recombinase XerD
MANVLLEAGLRVNELVQLIIPDLWFADAPVSTLLVRSAIAKGKRERKIPVSIRLSEILKQNFDENWTYCKAYPPRLDRMLSESP